MIEFDEVHKRYGKTEVLQGISLKVEAGELLVLLGASGCGKTTTLKLVNRLLEPSAGRVCIEGRDVASMDPVLLRRSIGYVFQRFGLFPHMTVRENVGVVPQLLGWQAKDIRERTAQLLELVGLGDLGVLDRFPAQLSGGQQQRVGLARALAARPRILLMDEPFGALDPITRGSMQLELRRLTRELGLTTILVTHDMTEALLLADRIAVVAGGRLLQLGPPQQLLLEPNGSAISDMLETPRRQFERLQALWEGRNDSELIRTAAGTAARPS